MSLYGLFINTVPFLGLLTLIVFVHEMGHFLVGRACGARVDAFSIGFGPELLHYVDRRGTRWRLALLPLGGYVKFHGDANGVSMMDEASIAQMPQSERRETLFGMTLWKRAATVAAGPAVNFLLAILLFAGIYFFNGRTVIAPEIGAVQPNSAAATAGFQPKDFITSVDGTPLDSFETMQRLVQADDGAPMVFGVKRGDRDISITATPRRQVTHTPFGDLKTSLLGVQADPSPANIRLVRSGVFGSLALGAQETWTNVANTGHFFKQLFAGHVSTDDLAGPIRIAQVSGRAAQLGLATYVYVIGLLSVSIGLLNLLPVPLLDGGFLMFFAIEAIRGRPLKEKTMEVGFRIGLTLVAALTIFVAYNDIRLTPGMSRTSAPHIAAPAAK